MYLGSVTSDDSGITNTGLTIVVAIVTFIMTFVITVTVTLIVTLICVKKAAEKVTSVNNPDDSSPQEEAFYDQLMPSSHSFTNGDDVKLQPNPAYGLNHEVNMDNNPAADYESCI